MSKIPFDITNPDHQNASKFKINRGTVWDHTLAALRSSQSSDPITNLSILFHDCGKAITAIDKGEGKTAYPGHEAEGMPIFQKIANRLKFSNKEKEAILFAIEHHMKGHKIKDLKQSSILKLRHSPHWPHLKHTFRADDASRGHPLFNPKEFSDRMDYIETIYKKFGETQEFEKRMSVLVNGKMIMELIPTAKGAEIGRIKSATREMIISKDFNVSQSDVNQFIIAMNR